MVARNETAFCLMDLLEGMVETRYVIHEQVDSHGRFRGSVEVEHASEPDSYDFHLEAFGNLELGKWGHDWQDGTAMLGVNQMES